MSFKVTVKSNTKSQTYRLVANQALTMIPVRIISFFVGSVKWIYSTSWSRYPHIESQIELSQFWKHLSHEFHQTKNLERSPPNKVQLNPNLVCGRAKGEAGQHRVEHCNRERFDSGLAGQGSSYGCAGAGLVEQDRRSVSIGQGYKVDYPSSTERRGNSYVGTMLW